MTDAAIREGFANLRPMVEYDNLYHSARCRSHADWLVGINASRAYSLAHGAHLTIGRVQTPTLAMIVARQREIDNFVQKDYWEVIAAFAAENGDYEGKWISDTNSKEGRIDKKEVAEVIARKVMGKPGTIVSTANEQKQQPPPLLYDLAELQRDCNRRFGLSAAKTLSVAQELYEKRKLITYPRTDSQHLPLDMQTKIGGIIKNMPEDAYGEYTKYLLGLPKLPMGKRIFDNAKVSDHHAIIPTGKQTNISSLSANEKNVYDMIVRKFLAAFYPPYVYDVTKIVTESEGESFLTQGNTVVDLGFRVLYVAENSVDDETLLPDVKEGDEFTVIESEFIKKKTEPPKPYTEGELLNAMENAGRFIDDDELKQQLKESGIGTPSTRAAIIERIIDVGYVLRKGKMLTPTEKGVKLIDVLPDELKSAETTGKWEKGLSSISKGTMESTRFMESINRFTRFIVTSADNSPSVQFEKEESKYSKSKKSTKKTPTQKLGHCSICEGGAVLENSKAFYCERWRDGCKFTIWKNSLQTYRVEINADFIKAILASGKVEKVSMYLPQTREKCVADIIVDKSKESILQVVNLAR